MSATGCVNHDRCYSRCDKTWWCYREQRSVDARCGATETRDDRNKPVVAAVLATDPVAAVPVREEVTT